MIYIAREVGKCWVRFVSEVESTRVKITSLVRGTFERLDALLQEDVTPDRVEENASHA